MVQIIMRTNTKDKPPPDIVGSIWELLKFGISISFLNKPIFKKFIVKNDTRKVKTIICRKRWSDADAWQSKPFEQPDGDCCSVWFY